MHLSLETLLHVSLMSIHASALKTSTSLHLSVDLAAFCCKVSHVLPPAGKEPLLYTMVQLLSLQLQGAVAYLARDPATRAFRVDAVHLGLALHAAQLLDAGGHTGTPYGFF